MMNPPGFCGFTKLEVAGAVNLVAVTGFLAGGVFCLIWDLWNGVKNYSSGSPENANNESLLLFVQL